MNKRNSGQNTNKENQTVNDLVEQLNHKCSHTKSHHNYAPVLITSCNQHGNRMNRNLKVSCRIENQILGNNSQAANDTEVELEL